MIDNLSVSVDQNVIYKEFQSFGEISDVRLAMDRLNGYGTIGFDNLEAAQKACDAKDGSQPEGRPMRIFFR